MTKGTRPWTLVIILTVGVAGWLIGQGTPPPTTAPAPTLVPSVPTPTPTAAHKRYPTPIPPYPAPKNWTLTVGPDPCTVKEGTKDAPVAVIERNIHWIRYESNAGQLMGIVFHAPAASPKASKPFKNMTFAGTDEDGSYMWALVCDEPNNGCFTGPALKDSSKGGYWKTDQILEGKKPCDAGIIIQP